MDKQQLAELLTYINLLDQTVGLKAQTYNDIMQAIDAASKKAVKK